MKKIRNMICFVLVVLALLVSVSMAETVHDIPKIHVNNVPIVFLSKEGVVINPVMVDGELYVPLTSLLDSLMLDYSESTDKIDISANTQTPAESEPEKIVITSENFKEYFDIAKTGRATSSKGNEFWGITTYNVTGEYTVTVTAKFPCKIYDLVFSISGNLEHFNEDADLVSEAKTLHFVMPQSGRCEETIYEEWKVNVNPYNIYAFGVQEKEYMGFWGVDINIKSGYITLE